MVYSPLAAAGAAGCAGSLAVAPFDFAQGVARLLQAVLVLGLRHSSCLRSLRSKPAKARFPLSRKVFIPLLPPLIVVITTISGGKGTFAESVKTKGGYKLVKFNARVKHLYTYKAYVKKIIDGDTLWVIVDCGFGVWVKQKIRLRGIDTPGITTQKGVESYKFVCQELKRVKFIIIKSHGRDKYDRYLSDIFYLKGETDPKEVLKKGEFLNQKLVDLNLANRE